MFSISPCPVSAFWDYFTPSQSRGVGATSACLYEAFRRGQVALNGEDFGVSGSTELAEVSTERSGRKSYIPPADHPWRRFKIRKHPYDREKS